MVFEIEGASLEKHLTNKQLAVFDGDGTLSNIYFDSWLYLSRKRGEYLFDKGVRIRRGEENRKYYIKNQKIGENVKKQDKVVSFKTEKRKMGEQFVHVHNKIYSEYLRDVQSGKSNAYLNMKNKLLKLWTHDGQFPLSRDFIKEEVVGKIPLRRDVMKIISLLRELGFKVGVITASFDLYAQRLNDLLPLDFCISNTPLDFNDQGFLEDFLQKRNFERTKRLELGKVAHELQIPLDKVIAFGDGETDIDIFWDTTGIAISSKNKVLLDSSVMAIRGFKELTTALKSMVKKRSVS